MRLVHASLGAALLMGMLGAAVPVAGETVIPGDPRTDPAVAEKLGRIRSEKMPDVSPVTTAWLGRQDRAKQAALDVARAAPSAFSIGGKHRAQETNYWCGPAAVQATLAHQGIGSTQAALASQLGTTKTYGTPWTGTANVTPPGGKSGYPVADVLNYRLAGNGRNFVYLAQPHNGYDSTTVADFVRRVVFDVYNVRYAVVGNAVEIVGVSPYWLVGHPRDHNIYHFYSIYKYSSAGAIMGYEDPAHSDAVSWGDGVPAYSTYDSAKLVRINSGHGYIW